LIVFAEVNKGIKGKGLFPISGFSSFPRRFLASDPPLALVLPELLADLSPDREPTGLVAGELLPATFANAVVLKKYQLVDILLGHMDRFPQLG
jgi:hypothetical protein